MSTLNESPSANRIHIGFFGSVNSGKSSLVNRLVGQNVAIVSDEPGTTTDVVHKAMEISPLGPCVLLDTAGFGDESKLGEARMNATKEALSKCDIAVMVISGCAVESFENLNDSKDLITYKEYCDYLEQRSIPVIWVVTKADILQNRPDTITVENRKYEVVCVSSSTGEGFNHFKEVLTRALPKDSNDALITGNLVKDNDTVLLVMPQDIQAPKGRLILPQVQTIRELLDKKCIVVSVTTDKMIAALEMLKNPPKLIITDSQVFPYVYENKPKESILTSFSVLFAALKGDIDYYLESAKKIDSLTEDSRVLIAECCTHAPLSEDIGRIKIPNLLRKRVGEGLSVEVVSGTDFPDDLSSYDLIIQCGGCMFNRTYIMSRIGRSRLQNVPMTNYGITIAHLTGILDKIAVV